MSNFDNTQSPDDDAGSPGGSIENLAAELRSLRLAHQRLQRATLVQEELAQLAVDGAGPGRLVTALAQRIGKSVLLEDRFFRGVGYALPSSGPSVSRPFRPEPTAALLDNPERQAVWAQLQTTHQPVLLPLAVEEGTPRGRIVAAIVVADDIVAYLSIGGRTQLVSADDLVIARQASLTVGFSFARQRTVFDTEARLKGDLLGALLQNNELPTDVLATRAALLAYDSTAPQTLLLVALDPIDSDADRLGWSDDAQRRELLESLGLWSRRVAPGSLVAEKDGQIVVLLAGDRFFTSGSSQNGRHPPNRGAKDHPARQPHAVSPTTSWSTPTEITAALHRHVEGILAGRTVSIAIAPTVPDWREVQRVYDVARRALQVLALLGERGQTISTADPRLAVFLLFDSTSPELRQDFVDLVLGPLVAYDQRGGHSLIPTLDAYLAHGGNLETTARTLSVHTSTLKYRLQRIAEVGGLNVRIPDHRFNAALALRLRSLNT